MEQASQPDRSNLPLTSASARRGQDEGCWGPRIALATILLVTALLRLRLLAVPLERDEGEYAYLGQLILRGEVPYVAAHNMKLPGIYYAYAGILALFGETDAGIRLGLLLINLASIILLYHLGRKLLDVTAGLSAAAAYAVLSLSQSVNGFAANAEHFVVLPMLGGVLLLAHRSDERRFTLIAGAGLLLGLAFVMKQHGAAFLVFGGLSVLIAGLARGRTLLRRTVADCVVFALASLAPFGLTCLGMYLAGAFEPFWFWTSTYAREYVSMIPLGLGLSELKRQVVYITGSSVALWLLAALGVTAPWWDVASRRAGGFIGLFAICSFLAVCPGLQFREHYFLLLLPAASLFIGVAVSALARMTAARRPGLAAAVRLGVPLVAVVVSLAQEQAYLFSLSPIAVSRAVYGSNPFPEAVEIGRYLREHADPEDRVAVIGSEPQIYFYARRRAATSYLYTYPLMEPQPFARRMQEDMIAQIERERPRFMVLVNVDASWLMRPDSSQLLLRWAERTVNETYEPVGIAEIVPGHDTVYRWDTAARDPQPRSRFHVVIFQRRS